MASTIGHPQEIDEHIESASIGHEKARIVFEELDRILASPFFRNAKRSSQFLDYVVRRTLEGHAEQLKERTIGTEVFQRPAEYVTGEDPVVRVQAGEVRRRLEHYYQSLPSPPAVRIELHAGSYSPNIHWMSDDSQPAEEDRGPSSIRPRRLQIPLVPAILVGLLLLLGVAAGLIYTRTRVSKDPPTAQEEFWAPIFATQQPVLICLAKPVVYRPSFDLYQRYEKAHPGSFQTEVERSNQVLPLKPNEKILWGDIVPYPDYGVAAGDVYAAVRVSSLLGQMGKPSQVRIGANYSFADLSNSPSVLVGAFNNKWTMQIMHGLRFSFNEDNGLYTIHEEIPGGRVWRTNLRQSQQEGEDYAIVARLLDSTTGQFTIVAAGLTGGGTQTAGEFISNSDFLERGLRGAPSGWQSRNMELVLKTTVTDSVAEPPQVIASYSW